ncbi:hypothetical protein ACFSJW_06175 [Flavobacterium artemisiae]|uniref:Lipoprotein n=1 Tax=Flavobacterium artemisiae TaxID=2126556 RepID=A0ABW4HCQ5_9FLAO
MTKQKYLILSNIGIIAIVFLLNSCSSFKNNEIIIPIDEKTTDIELSLGEIDKYITIEKRQNSIDVTRNYFVDISEGIYPYIKNHTFEIPKEFELQTEKSIELRKSYYYTKNGNVKLILYEWNVADKSEVEKEKFKSIFLNIERKVTQKIGQPFFKKIESKKVRNDKTFRDDVKWQSPELNAYLFRFGDRNNTYNQIILAIYKD